MRLSEELKWVLGDLKLRDVEFDKITIKPKSKQMARGGHSILMGSDARVAGYTIYWHGAFNWKCDRSSLKLLLHELKHVEQIYRGKLDRWSNSVAYASHGVVSTSKTVLDWLPFIDVDTEHKYEKEAKRFANRNIDAVIERCRDLQRVGWPEVTFSPAEVTVRHAAEDVAWMAALDF